MCHFPMLPGRKLIEHFNLDVKPGQRIAIVGPDRLRKDHADQSAHALL